MPKTAGAKAQVAWPSAVIAAMTRGALRRWSRRELTPESLLVGLVAQPLPVPEQVLRVHAPGAVEQRRLQLGR
ncbi:MAG TPA: hypothetical protein VKF59_07435, partial [Candidatus Dormibacteraeota bacterium]|nr:hypothetical protein [Candidatus Dormibacteraeota bacterium]